MDKKQNKRFSLTPDNLNQLCILNFKSKACSLLIAALLQNISQVTFMVALDDFPLKLLVGNLDIYRITIYKFNIFFNITLMSYSHILSDHIRKALM